MYFSLVCFVLSFPVFYNSNKHSCWIIEADEGQRVEVYAEEIHIFSGCSSGRFMVNIHNGDSGK